MSALAQYALQLSRMSSTSANESVRLRDEARGLFGRLEEVDADRRERYRDFGQSRQPPQSCANTDWGAEKQC